MTNTTLTATQHDILHSFSRVVGGRMQEIGPDATFGHTQPLRLEMQRLVSHPPHLNYIMSLEPMLAHKSPAELRSFWSDVWELSTKHKTVGAMQQALEKAEASSNVSTRQAAQVARDLIQYLEPRQSAAKQIWSRYQWAKITGDKTKELELLDRGFNLQFTEMVGRASAAQTGTSQLGLFGNYDFMQSLFKHRTELSQVASRENDLQAFWKPVFQHLGQRAPTLESAAQQKGFWQAHGGALAFASVAAMAVGAVLFGIFNDNSREKKSLSKDCAASRI